MTYDATLEPPPREPIARPERFLGPDSLRAAQVEEAAFAALARIDRCIARFDGKFPAPASAGGHYPLIDNVEWTSGFWTGCLWLAYEFTGSDRYRWAAESHVEGYAQRILQHINVDHHDLGFLYSLSCVAAYKLTGSAVARDIALAAANLLSKRYLPDAGIIQAWGDLSDPGQRGRMIIDCNLNLPLLYWATTVTGDGGFAHVADSHIENAARYLVRPDGSTFHTFYLDARTGAPKHGSTHQGFSDTSCWSRGQAWGIAGFALAYRFKRDPALLAVAARLANYFLNRLPSDLICNWDLVFVDDGAQRDSSAAAIAACGLLELAMHLPQMDADRPLYEAAALKIVGSLIGRYACREDDPGDGLLDQGVYHMPKGIGVNERCIWGDYFYLEALMRLTRVWETYW